MFLSLESGGLWENEGMWQKRRGEGGQSGLGWCESQQVTEVPFEFRTNRNTECLPQKVEWLITMAACFHLAPSAHLSCFPQTTVTGAPTCERAAVQLHIKRLADALILAQWERAHERPRRPWMLWSSSKSKFDNRWREDGGDGEPTKQHITGTEPERCLSDPHEVTCSPQQPVWAAVFTQTSVVREVSESGSRSFMEQIRQLEAR